MKKISPNGAYLAIFIFCFLTRPLHALNDSITTTTIKHPGLSRYAECLAEQQDTEIVAPTRYIAGKKVWKETKYTLETHKSLFILLASEGTKSGIFSQGSSIITPAFIDKMDIIGDKETPGWIRCFVDDTLSLVGHAHLVNLLTTPIIDVEMLKKRQDTIKFFIANPELCTRIEHVASQLKKVEKYLIPLTEEKIGFGRFYIFNLILFTRYNYHDWWCAKLLSMVFKKDFSWLNWERLNKSSCGLSTKWLLDRAIQIGSLPASIVFQRTNQSKFFIYSSRFMGILALLFAPFEFFESPYAYICSVGKKLACCLNGLKDLAAFMMRHKSVVQLDCSLEPLFMFARTDQPDDLARMLHLASHKSIRTGHVSPVLRKGRPIALWNNIRRAYREIRAALHVFGQLEAYARLARIYRAHETSSTPYCFVDYVSSDEPSLVMDDFWNPVIDNPITNSLTMDAEHARTLVVTGPNTGGKTTMIKSCAYTILLAQTCGLAAARSCTLTPFSHLHAHLNIADSLARGISTFKMEILEAKKLVELVYSCTYGQFCFIVMDEAFRGTSAREGEEISCRFTEQLSQHKNCCTIVATHYHKMGELAHCAQKHVDVIIHDDGSYTRTFKLKEGMSTVTIADKLLEEEQLLFFKKEVW